MENKGGGSDLNRWLEPQAIDLARASGWISPLPQTLLEAGLHQTDSNRLKVHLTNTVNA